MDYDVLRTSTQEIRDKYLKEELGEEKSTVIDKYGLICNERLYWQRVKDKYPTQEYFSHKFTKKASPLGMIFQIYRLCYAKVKYFEKNWDDYCACVYHWKNGFVETDIYNMEFIKHRSTGIVIDLRNLCNINKIEEFIKLCNYLESRDALEKKYTIEGLDY